MPERRRLGAAAFGLFALALAVVLWAGCAPAHHGETRVANATAYPVGVNETTAPEPARDARILDVLTFNTALLPVIAASTRQAERVAVMAPNLVGYDVLVLQELFVNDWREQLLTELASYYPFRTEVVGRDGAGGNPFRQDGGIVILSRWPIERQAIRTFGGVCSGTDCLADKGVAYAQVRKGRYTYHVFGTHAQSVYGFGVERVRAAQFELWRGFIESLDIPTEEPVLLAGDFNVDAYSTELDAMLDTLNAVRPVLTGSARYSWDPVYNRLASGPRQSLDYVLVAADYAQPVAAWNRVVPLRAGELDLSDHFAVWGRVVMAER